VDKGVVPCCEDVADSKDITTSILRAKGSFLFGFSSLFGSFFSLSGFLFGVLSGSFGLFGLSRLYLCHNIKIIFTNNQIFIINQTKQTVSILNKGNLS
jgi:hypothetical protein